MARWVVTAALVLAFASGSVQAQSPRLGYRAGLPVPESAPAPTGRLVAGGILGVAAAYGVGSLIYELGGGGRICGDDPCGLGAGIVTAVFIEPLVVPLGVHLADYRKGNYAATLFGSLVVGGGVLLAGSQLGLDDELLIAVPMGQIVGAVIGERLSRRH